MTTRPYRHSIPAEILALSHERDQLRRRGQYDRADVLKRQIEDAGYLVKDNPHGAHLVTLPGIEVDGKMYRTARHLPSLLDEPDVYTFSVNILAQNSFEETRRCVESVLRHRGNARVEIVLVDNASLDGFDLWAESLRYREDDVRVLRTTRVAGAAEARNFGLKQSRGRYILLLASNVEVTGDIFTPLEQVLADDRVGLTGLRGSRTEDLRHFAASSRDDVEVVDALCMAFRRRLLKQAGLFDERYRFPHYMDIDFSFAIRDCGVETRLALDLPVVCHAVTHTTNMSDAEQTRLHKRNFYRFLEKWGDRYDLLLQES